MEALEPEIFKDVFSGKDEKNLHSGGESVKLDSMGLDDNRFGFTRIDGEHTATGDLTAANPHYKDGGEAYRLNCSHCIVSYEMRRRGYDVVATGRTRGMDVSDWEELFEGFQPEWPKSRTLSEINVVFDAVARDWGDGARGTVYGVWSAFPDQAHFFSFEIMNGKVVFVDGQSGRFDVGHLSLMLPETIRYGRVDNLAASDQIKNAVRNKTEEDVK